MQKHALYVHLLLLTQKSLISRLLRAVISNKPLQAHLNKGLDQPEELQFINLSCFCLCPSMLSLLALPEPWCSFLPLLSSLEFWLEFTVPNCTSLSRM